MKIIEIMPIFELCGVTRFVTDLCNQLVEQHEVVLIVFYPTPRSRQPELSSRVKLLELGKEPGLSPMLCQRLRTVLQQEKADVVHIHTASALQYAALAILTVRTSRYYYTLHSEAKFEIPSRLGRKLVECTLLRPGVCQTISPSAFVANSLSFATPHIPLGRDLREEQRVDAAAAQQMADIRNRHNGQILMNVSNLTPVKNQLMLCQAVLELLEKGYNVELVLIGNAPDAAYFQKLMPLLRHERIHYIGARNKIPAYMVEADFFCLSSITESGPLVLIEAFFAGLIPICTPCGDVPNKIRHGDNGLCADDCSVRAYKAVLEEALNLPESRRRRMSEAAGQSYPAYSMESCAAQYIKLFQRHSA